MYVKRFCLQRALYHTLVSPIARGCLLIFDNRAKAKERRQSFPGRKTILSGQAYPPPATQETLLLLKNATSPLDQAPCCGATGGTTKLPTREQTRSRRQGFEHCWVSHPTRPPPDPDLFTSTVLPGRALPFTRSQGDNRTALGAPCREEATQGHSLTHLALPLPGREGGGERAAHLSEHERNSLFVSIWRSSTDGGKAFFS